jgi:TonB family protein
VLEAYRRAIVEMNFRVIEETDERIEAVATARRNPTRVWVRTGPSDTLRTDVVVTSAYVPAGGNLTHYPYELGYRASKHLDRNAGLAYVYPQLIHPRDSRGCQAPPVENWNDVSMPVLVGGVDALTQQLTYTTAAIEAGVEGRVVVLAVVDETGRVSCAMIDAGLPHGLNANALAAVVSARFEPAVFQGEPISVMISLPLTFRFRR